MNNSNYQPGEQYKEVDYDADIDSNQVRRRIFVNRIRMMNKEPFYGTIAMNLRLQEVEKDSKIQRIAIDGRNIKYNPWFIHALDDDEIVFTLAHEVMHMVLRHLTRKGKREGDIFYDAGDYVINNILVRDNVGKFPGVGGLYDPDYANKTTEQIYDELKQKKQDGGGSGDGDGSSSGNNFDDHIEIQQGDDNSQDDENTVTLTEDEMSQLDNEMQSSIMQAAEAARSSGAGAMPAEIERMIEELSEPRMNWRDFIRENAKSQIRCDYSWKSPNKRFQSMGIIIPGMTVDDHYEFVVALDASGSMSTEQLRDFLGEIYFIADCFTSFKVGVFTFDTKAYGYKEFDQDNIDELLEYKPKGGGGTDFMACWDYMKEHDICPNTFIMLTDGMPHNSWGDPEYCETIFLIHDEHAISNKVTAPFGTTLYYDDYVTD